MRKINRLNYNTNKWKQIKKYLKKDIHEIMDLTKNLPVKLFEGFGENLIEYAKELEELDAKIKIEKKEIIESKNGWKI